MVTNADYYQLVEKRKAILAEMRTTEERMQELAAEMVVCVLEIKCVREELKGNGEY